MRRNIMFFGVNDFIFDRFIPFFKKENVLCLDDNIIMLENLKKNFNFFVYPICENTFDFFIFKKFLEKNLVKLDEVIFNVDYFFESKPLFNIDINKIDFFSNFKILFIFFYNIFPLLLKSKKTFFTFLINKSCSDKNSFLFQSAFINNLLITFMKEMNRECVFDNLEIKFNCISLENINLSYKKNIYPYRMHKIKDKSLYQVYTYMVNSNLKNKILIP